MMTIRTLLLTPWMTPYRVISYERAIVLSFLGKVEVVEESRCYGGLRALNPGLRQVLCLDRELRGLYQLVQVVDVVQIISGLESHRSDPQNSADVPVDTLLGL